MALFQNKNAQPRNFILRVGVRNGKEKALTFDSLHHTDIAIACVDTVGVSLCRNIIIGVCKRRDRLQWHCIHIMGLNHHHSFF